MNELIPMPYKKVLSNKDELGISIITPDCPQKLLIFLIPLGLLFLMKNKDNNIFLPKPSYQKHGSDTYKAIPAPLISFDTDMLDKISLMLDGLKKAKSIQGLRKNMAKSDSQQGRMNFGIMKELVDVFGGALGESNKSQIQNITNVMSMFDKIKDVKKIIDVQKSARSNNEDDPSLQINNIIDVIKPMLPEQHAKNIDSFKKIAQMMKFMSIFEDSNTENNEQEEKQTDD